MTIVKAEVRWMARGSEERKESLWSNFQGKQLKTSSISQVRLPELNQKKRLSFQTAFFSL